MTDIEVNIINQELNVEFAEQTIVVEFAEQTIDVEFTQQTIDVELTEQTIEINVDNTIAVEPAQYGIYTAGEILNGHRLVYLKDGKAYKASNDNPDCFNRIVGMTVNAALEDELVNVKQGKIVNPGWALSPNTLYYLGIDGEITSVPPTSGILQAIGYSYDTDTMYINTNIAIRR